MVENTCNSRDPCTSNLSKYDDVQLALLSVWLQVCDAALQLRLPTGQQGTPAWRIAVACKINIAQLMSLETGLMKANPGGITSTMYVIGKAKANAKEAVCRLYASRT